MSNNAQFNLTQAAVITLLFKALPYPQHVSDVALDHKNVVLFTWRGDKWCVNCLTLSADLREDGMLTSNNAAILLGTLLERQWIQDNLHVSMEGLPASHAVELCQ